MPETPDAAVELLGPFADSNREEFDHPDDLTDAEAEASQVMYHEVDDLDDDLERMPGPSRGPRPPDRTGGSAGPLGPSPGQAGQVLAGTLSDNPNCLAPTQAPAIASVWSCRQRADASMHACKLVC
jgi:hypothetical protein